MMTPTHFKVMIWALIEIQRNPMPSILLSTIREEWNKQKQQHDKNNQSNTTKKHSIYTNHGIDNTTGSKPIIFSPPSLELHRKDPFK